MKKTTFFYLFIMSFIFISCSKDEDDIYGLESARCDLEIKHATDGGEVSGVGSGIFKKGDEVSLSLALKDNHILKGWYDYKADTLMSDNLEFSFIIQKSQTIEVRYIRTDDTIKITPSVKEITGFYKDKKSMTFNISSPTYDKFKGYIIAENANVVDFTLNGENANAQKEIDFSGGDIPVTIYYKSKTEGRTGNFKLIVFPVLAPDNRKELSIKLFNNGVSFNISGVNGNITLTRTNASVSGWFDLWRGVIGNTQFTLSSVEQDTFVIHDVIEHNEVLGWDIIRNGIKNYNVNNNSVVHTGTKINSGTHTLTAAYSEFNRSYIYQSNMGGSVAKYGRYGVEAEEWRTTHYDTLYVENSVGYQKVISVPVKFNR